MSNVLGQVDAWGLVKGDVLVVLFNGETQLAICTIAGQAYEMQCGEGATIQYETGSTQQFHYHDQRPRFIRVGNIPLGKNPLRDLLNWRRNYE